MNGHELIESTKKELRFQSLPVSMLTMCEEDVVRAYASDACSIIHKSVGLDQYRERLKQCEHDWTDVSQVSVVRE